MKPIQSPQPWGWVCVLGMGCVLLADPHVGSAQSMRASVPPAGKASAAKTQRPAWSEIASSVKASLAQTKGYQAGDLVTREDASAILTELKTLGWEVKEPSSLSERLLSSSDEMVRQLRDKRGVRFMREIGGIPEGYDRLDRLRSQPNGQRRLRELIEQPGGHTLIQYMATTPGGKNMGRELSSKKRGDFNAATKRIYTESQLLAELKARYDAESANLPK